MPSDTRPYTSAYLLPASSAPTLVPALKPAAPSPSDAPASDDASLAVDRALLRALCSPEMRFAFEPVVPLPPTSGDAADHGPWCPALPPASVVDRARSRVFAVRIRAKNRECYRNAALTLLQHPALADEGAVYCEGLVVSADCPATNPIEHGWLELPGATDGTAKPVAPGAAAPVIIDPTPCYHRREAAPRAYFPAFRWTRPEVLELLLERDGHFRFRDSLPEWGRLEPTWIPAVRAAWTAAEAVLRATGYAPHLTDRADLEWIVARF